MRVSGPKQEYLFRHRKWCQLALKKFFQVLGLFFRYEFFRIGIQVGLNQGYGNCFSFFFESFEK